MKRMIAAVTAMAAGILVWTSVSFAAGFRLPEVDSAAMGMANAFVGQADNPSAVWFNPAGITRLDGTQVSGGIVGIYPVMTHETTIGTTEVSERKVHMPVHLFTTHKLNDSLSFGFGITSPFGLSTDWDPVNSVTKYVATFTKVVTIDINPNIAYKLNDNLSFAVGVAYMNLKATLEKTINLLGGTNPALDRNFRLSGDGDGWGANAAVMYAFSDTLHAGLSYRSRVKVDVDGDASLTGVASGSGSTSITLPDLIQLGASYRPTGSLTLNADLEYTAWSTYDRIVVKSNIASFNKTDEKQWENVWGLRIGGQYALSGQWKVRAGYVYDQNPVEEEHFETRTPDSDRQGVSLGAGYAGGNISVDVAYLYLRFNDRTINNSTADDATGAPNALNGTYKSQVHLAGVTIGYKF